MSYHSKHKKMVVVCAYIGEGGSETLEQVHATHHTRFFCVEIDGKMLLFARRWKEQVKRFNRRMLSYVPVSKRSRSNRKR